MTHPSQQLQFEKLLNEWLTMYDIATENLFIGYSNVHLTEVKLHLAVREAYFSRIMAEIYTIPTYHYKNLASDCLLIELHRKDAHFAMDYVNNYLGPLLENKVDPDLMNTAITFVIKKRKY